MPDFVTLVSTLRSGVDLQNTKLSTTRLLCNHRQFDGLDNFRVQLNVDVELTYFAQYTFRQTHFRFGHLYAGGSNRISDVARANGAEEFTFVTRISRDSH